MVGSVHARGMNTNFFKRLGLNTLVKFFTLAIFLVCIWSLVFYACQVLRNDIQRLLGEQQFSAVSIVAEDINTELNNRLRALEQVAAKITPAMLDNAPALQIFLEDRINFGSLFSGGVYVTRLDGTAIADLPASTGRIGVSYIERDYIATPLKEGKNRIGEPVIGKKLKSPIIGMATPVRDAKGVVIGALAGVINLGIPNFLENIIEHRYGKTGGYLIVSPQQRRIITGTDKHRIMEAFPVTGLLPLFDRFLNGYEGSGVGINSLGTEVLSSAKSIPATGWYLSASIPTIEAFAPINILQQRLLVAAFFLTLIAGGLAWWLNRIQQANELLEQRVDKQTMDLQSSNERLRIFVENANDVLFALTPEGIFSYVSPRWKEAFGYEQSDTIGQPFKPFVHPDDFQGCLTFMQQVFETGEKQEGVEYRVLCTDGAYRSYKANASMVKDPVDGTLTLVGIGRDITEQKLTEEKLRTSKELYHSLVETSQDLIWRCDADGRYTYLNLAWEQVFGYDLDEMLGRKISDFQSTENAMHNLSIFSRLMQGETLEHYESTHIGKSGNEIHLVFNAMFLTDENGEFSGASGTAYDITERKRMEKTLRESEEKYRIILEESSDAIFTLTDKGQYKYVNQAFSKGVGRPVDEIIGKTLWEVFPKEEADQRFASLNRSIRAQHMEVIEVCIPLEDGNHYYMTTITPIKDTKGEILSVIGSAKNITQLKHTENLLREMAKTLEEQKHELQQINETLEQRVEERTKELSISKTRFDQLAEQSRSMIWEVDANGLYTYVNHVSEAVFGYRPEEMVGRMHFYDVFPESEQERIKQLIAPVFENKAHILNLENQTLTKDGRLLWWTTNGIPILNNDGTLLGYRGSDTDITESKKLKEQLQQSQKMEAVGQLAGGLAHDFNNVLSIINGYCCLMQMEMEFNEQQKEYIGRILGASGRAAELTRSMLAFSRKQVMNPQHQNLNRVVSSVGTFLEKILGENIRFKTVTKDANLPVNIDGGQIEQVLINLTNNARDAMPDGGELTLATERLDMDESFIVAHGFGMPGRYAVITVSDTGTGMDETIRKKIFEPFFTTKAVDKGTGLGLAMVYGIVKQHNGFVDVSSQPGCGSSFAIYLPIAGFEAPGSEAKTEVSAGALTGSETILVAEDSADVREFMNKVLTKLGYRVILAGDGQDAVDRFRENADEIRLIIMDMVMPNKSGKAAYDEILQIKPDTMALFSSGHSANIIQQQGELGSNADFMAKPVKPDELIKKVREMLDRSIINA